MLDTECLVRYTHIMRPKKPAVGEYYHVFNRGVNKQQIFFDERDYVRFLFYILFFRAPLPHYNISRRVSSFLESGDFGILPARIEQIISKRDTELVAFSLMPNHFHLILNEKNEGGISSMMQRVLDGYTRYFHTKYEKSGHVFTGPFRIVHIKDNTQLLYLSAYIHKNPKEVGLRRDRIDTYSWSSYQDFVRRNRWDRLLAREIVLGQFDTPADYAKFVETSSAKEMPDESPLIDF